MKNKMAIGLLLAVCMMLFTSFLNFGSADVLEIGEKMFFTQINDIYYNFDDYKDTTIIVEGMYTNGASNPAVYRFGPGCCGNDGAGGFRLYYNRALPTENDWIKVAGTPELVLSELGFDILYLNVTSLEIKKERGAEFVFQ